MAQSAMKTCEVCVSAPGTQYCLQCEQYFCESCKGLHKRQKVSKNHNFQSASNVIAEVKSKCTDHNEDFIFMCVTCDKLICQRCATDKHNGHKFGDIENCISTLKATAEKRIKSNNDDITRNLQNIKIAASQFDLGVQDVIKAITEDGRKVKAMIDKHIEQMIKTIKEKAEIEKQKLMKIMEETQATYEKGNQLMQRQKEVVKKGKDSSLILELKMLVDGIDKLQVKEIPVFPTVTYTQRTTTETEIGQLIGTYNFREMESVSSSKGSEYDWTTQRPERKTKEVEHGHLYRCTSCGDERIVKPYRYRNAIQIPLCSKCDGFLDYVKEL